VSRQQRRAEIANCYWCSPEHNPTSCSKVPVHGHSTNSLLTKVIALAPDGSISSDASACVMARGTATRIEIDTVRQLADLIENMPPTEPSR
jgi:hypothetical protein